MYSEYGKQEPRQEVPYSKSRDCSVGPAFRKRANPDGGGADCASLAASSVNLTQTQQLRIYLIWQRYSIRLIVQQGSKLNSGLVLNVHYSEHSSHEHSPTLAQILNFDFIPHSMDVFLCFKNITIFETLVNKGFIANRWNFLGLSKWLQLLPVVCSSVSAYTKVPIPREINRINTLMIHYINTILR